MQGITRPESSQELAEFTNGPSSGWMYTLNGVHSKWGVAEQYLEPGDKIIFHYTDDFNYEPDTKGWTTPTENVNSVTTDTKTATTIFLCGNSTVVDQAHEPYASWGQMIPRRYWSFRRRRRAS